jgi:N-acyl-D-amino-acid deacylase
VLDRSRPRRTLIRDATVVDGSGAPRRNADVVLDDSTIVAVAAPGSVRPDRSAVTAVVEAQGLVLSPGFVDMHAHSDLQILARPDHYAKLSQGVTSELLGQDGLSYAPVDDAVLAAMRAQLAGWNDDPDGFDYSWRSVAGYLDRLDRGVATNVAYLVPQGTVRALVLGFDDRPAGPAEIAQMQELVRTGIAEGAVGMSSGLTYPPGMYASTAELAALCRTVAAAGGFYAPHHRSYGRDALAAYTEMIELSRVTGCPLHLAHATLNFAPNAGRAPELLALVDAALAEGVDLTLDSYPYLAGATTLAAMLPSWATAGGPAATLARLRDPTLLERMRADLEVHGSDGSHGVPVDWDTVEISGVRHPGLGAAVGRTVARLARDGGQEPFSVFAAMLRDDRLGTGILQHVGHEENVRAVLQHRVHTGGSDGILVGDKPHPRAWGTFPRYLGHYCRDLGLLTLEETVHHLTGRPAARLGWSRRGLVRAGYAADLVLFDPETIHDTATYEQPRQPATGIHAVYVNGVAAVADGRATGALAGRVLRSAAATAGDQTAGREPFSR